MVHVNSKGGGYDKQISFLEWSIKKYLIPAKLIVVYGEAKEQYESIKSKSESNRLYTISEYIKKRNLYNEDIMVLDPDTIFTKSIDISKYSFPYNTIRVQNYSRYFSAFSEQAENAKIIFGKNVIPVVCPFVAKGKTISDFFDLTLYTMMGYLSKNIKMIWETGMFAMGASIVKGKFNVISDNFWPVANFYEEDFNQDGYDGIHYGFEIKLKNGESFKKWGSFSTFNSVPLDDSHHVSKKFIQHLKEFENLK